MGGLVAQAFHFADQDGGGDICFTEFATWYSSVCFSEAFQHLDEAECHLRNMVRKHNLPFFEVERYHRLFNKYDTDKGGTICKEEFGPFIIECLQIPANVGLPESRLHELWRTADMDGSG